MLIEITLRAEGHCAEALADALMQSGALSVSIEDAQADTVDEQPLYGEPGFAPAKYAYAWARSRLRVLAEQGRADAIVEAAGLATKTAPAIEQRVAVEDTDWVRATQSQFMPTRISERLWIVPSWHQPPDPHAVIVRLDPGVAFGTGTHPTTRLCLAWLDQNVFRSASVLDYGCGSGILAIAAAKLGAGRVVGTDIDPQALDAARANASANGVSPPHGRPKAGAVPLGGTARSAREQMSPLGGTARRAKGASMCASYTDPRGLSQSATPFDIVLANILSNPLKLLAPALLARVAPRGSLVISGILERQADDVMATYRRADPTLPLSVWRSEDGWVCLAGTRTSKVRG